MQPDAGDTTVKKALPPALVSPAPELLDVRGVASEMSVSIAHVRRLAAAGLMPPPVKLGRILRWRRAAISAWIASGCPPQL